MPRSRPASNPISFHKPTGQFYVTRIGKRIYLGTDEKGALATYYDLARGESPRQAVSKAAPISAKELANRFVASQRANWRNAGDTSRAYEDWLRRLLKDHPGLMADEFTVEDFAAWKESLRRRKYAPQSINHYLSVVRAMFAFAEDAELLGRIPRLRRVKNESRSAMRSKPKALYTTEQIQKLIANGDGQVRLMILLALNCGFGPKDLQDVQWDHFQGDRVTLPRSKTGICQTYRLRLQDILRTYQPPRSQWFFPSPMGKRWHPDNFSQDLRAINKANGLDWGCLDFRHTFGSQLAQKGESLYKIATLMSNSPAICQRHYAALIPETMHDTVEFPAGAPITVAPLSGFHDAATNELLQRLLRELQAFRSGVTPHPGERVDDEDSSSVVEIQPPNG